MDHKALWLTPFLALSLVAVTGCGSDDAEGTPVGNCTLVDLGDGTSAIRCPDGTELVVENGRGADGKDGKDGTDGKDGKDGADGEDGKDGKDAESPCSLTDNGDGTHSITCGGTSVILGDGCEQGFPVNLYVTDPKEEPEDAMTLTLFQATDCTWLRQSLYVTKYPGAELPKALSRIEKIDKWIAISSNENLDEVSFPRLTTIGGEIDIYENEALAKLDFPVLTTIGTRLDIYENGALEEMSFPALTTVEEGVYLYQDDVLEKVTLPALKTVGSTVHIEKNPRLMEMSFASLTTIGKDLWVYDNASLAAVDGFPALESVAEWFAIRQNESLERVSDFKALESVGGLEIAANDALTSIGDLPALEEITGFGEGPAAAYSILYIAENRLLSSIGGLGHVDGIDGHVMIADNPELEKEDIEDLLDGIQVTGVTTVCGNKSGPSC